MVRDRAGWGGGSDRLGRDTRVGRAGGRDSVGREE